MRRRVVRGSAQDLRLLLGINIAASSELGGKPAPRRQRQGCDDSLAPAGRRRAAPPNN